MARQAKKSGDYTHRDVEVLGSIEGIRRRPGMYVGGANKDGLHQLIQEVCDNALDEFLAGSNDQMHVDIDTDEQTVSVTDAGRGVPVSMHAKAKIPTIVAVFTKIHAGGKFSKDAYKTSAGLHGVGVTAVNALSEWLDVSTVRQRKIWRASFERGKLLEFGEIDKAGRDDCGTTVTFRPDPTIFKARIDPKMVRKMLEHVPYLCPGLAVTLTVDGEKESLTQSGGVKALLGKHVGHRRHLAHTPIIIRNDWIDAALVWTDLDGDEWHTYVNLLPIVDGGAHITGSRSAVTKAFEGESVDGGSLRDGLRMVIHMRMGEPSFEGQTKSKVTNPELRRDVGDLVRDTLIVYFKKHPRIRTAILRRAKDLAALRSEHKEKKATLKAIKDAAHRSKLPPKLAAATSAAPRDRELYLLEGESASGSARAARDAKYQEVLPLRGKVLNAARASLARLMQNKEMHEIIASIGTGLGDACNPAKARIGKIMLLMDADPDGQHISALIVTMMAIHMKPIIKAKMLYVVRSPLFMGAYKDHHFFGATIDEVEERAVNANVKGKLTITRFKGHGEANADELREYAFAPKTRRLQRVRFKDEDKELDMVYEYMGPDTSARREMLGIED